MDAWMSFWKGAVNGGKRKKGSNGEYGIYVPIHFYLYGNMNLVTLPTRYYYSTHSLVETI
jgi:hypothetical protein